MKATPLSNVVVTNGRMNGVAILDAIPNGELNTARRL